MASFTLGLALEADVAPAITREGLLVTEADAARPITPGRVYPWSYAPLLPIVERLEWLTDIEPGIDAELRQALRRRPRLQLTLSHWMSAATLANAIARVRANFAGLWRLPAWTIPGGADQTAVMTRDLEIRQRRANGAVVTARFLVIDGAGDDATGLDEYLSSPVLLEAFELGSALEASAGQQVEIIDAGVGDVAIEVLHDWLSERHIARLRDVGDAALTARREFLHLVRGRARAFWIAPRAPRLELVQAIGAADTTIRIVPAAPAADYVGRHIVLDVAGAAILREITAASEDAGDHVLTIAATGVALPITTTVHYLLRVRLDSDAVEMRHDGKTTLTAVPVVEVP